MKKGMALLLAAMLLIPVWAEALTVKYEDLFDAGRVLEINFEVDEAVWERMLSHAMDKEVICCNVTVNGEEYYSVGVNCKGNSSLTRVENGRYSLRVTFDEYVHQQSLQGLDKILLNNMYGDPTYMKEYLSYSLFRQMGVPTPLCTYAHVTVNGEEYGLMLAVEAVEDDFEARSFSTEAGFLYKVETVGMDGMGLDRRIIPQERQRRGAGEGFWNDFSDRTRPTVPSVTAGPDASASLPPRNKGFFGDANGADLRYKDDRMESYASIFNGAEDIYTEKDAARVISALRTLQSGTDDAVAAVFDMGEIAKYFAVNTLLVNIDQYAGPLMHNYYLYERDGVLSLLPWDCSYSFGGFGVQDTSELIEYPIDSPVFRAPLSERPLLDRLFANEEWLAAYHEAVEEALTFLENGAFASRVQAVREWIAPYVRAETNAFYSYEQFLGAADALVTVFDLRAEHVRGQLSGMPAAKDASRNDGNAADTASLPALEVLGSLETEEKQFAANGTPAPGAQDAFRPPQGPEGVPVAPAEAGGAAVPEPLEGAPAQEPGASGAPQDGSAPSPKGTDGTAAVLILLLIAVLVTGTGLILFRRK